VLDIGIFQPAGDAPLGAFGGISKIQTVTYSLPAGEGAERGQGTAADSHHLVACAINCARSTLP
jgi:hypothetical protein